MLPHISRCILVCLLGMTFMAACGDDDDGGGACNDSDDCPGGACVDSICVVSGDGGIGDAMMRDGGGGNTDAGPCDSERCGPAAQCCGADEECVDDFLCAPLCDGTRCGDNGLTCCGAGQQCLDGVVCAAACEAEEALCGEDLDVCCAAGDICLDSACATPGDPCGDDYDCLVEGSYCEPTIGLCLPNPSGSICEVRPEFDDVQLEVEWHWEGLVDAGEAFDQVAASPMVGDVSGDGIPDVVVPVYSNSSGARTVLVALSGDTGELLWHVPHGDLGPRWLMSVALGNLDPSDDALEIVYHSRAAGLVVLDGDGVTVLASAAGTAGNTSPSLADLDHDGVTEIIAGCHVLSFEEDAGAFTLTERFSNSCSSETQSFANTLAADLNGDGNLEITSGGVTYDASGTELWNRANQHGRPATADLNGDGAPEIVVVRDGELVILDAASGMVHVGAGGDWLGEAVTLPGGGLGGAPTVADFDGDGMPEVSTAGQGCYVVFDVDCMTTPPRAGGTCTRPADDPASTCDDEFGELVLWARPTQDISSSVTGSSVFDFQGDGVSEVIYNDECFLHVYDGRDGRELLTTPRANSSRTGIEYPLVADVDRDGNSEIVVPANNDQAVRRDGCPAAYAAALGVPVEMLPADIATGTHGIFVFGDPGDRWVRTRPIWNQYTYHVTNISDVGEVPTTEADNWSEEGLNNYRQNVQGAGVFNAPDLRVELDAVSMCGRSAIRLSAVVTNAGSRGVPAGVPVEFRQTAPMSALVGSEVTSMPLLPGASERITVTVTDVPLGEELDFEVVVDGASSGVALECNEDNNGATATEMCSLLL